MTERFIQDKQEIKLFVVHFTQADYGQRITRQLGEGKETWLTLFMYKDIFELYKIITKQKYRHFCGCNTTANPDQFYDRVKSYVTDMSAMKKVFNMASGVRLVAIQNLGTAIYSFSFLVILEINMPKDIGGGGILMLLYLEP